MKGPTRASCSWQSSQQLDRQIFTSEVFLLSIAAATELLFFSSRFVSFAVFSSYFFFFFALRLLSCWAAASESRCILSQPQAHLIFLFFFVHASHFKLKIRKKHYGAHAQKAMPPREGWPGCRGKGGVGSVETGAKGCWRKKKFLLPPPAAVSLGSRRNKKEIKAKN